MVVLGGFLAAFAAFLAGASGFGLGLTATPALLLAGFSLPFVVTANLLISVATRISVAWRFRSHVQSRRALLLIAGAAPGLWLGSQAGALNTHTLKAGAGIVVAIGALALAWTERRPFVLRVRFLTPFAGFCGGFLGTTTGLIGIPPALLLTQRRVATKAFFADLAVYFVATSSIGLAVLALDHRFSGAAARDTLYWLPGVIAANLLGTSLGVRLPDALFRRFALSIAFVAGIVTVATA
jgi:uncharacterized membrane protein YfcA